MDEIRKRTFEMLPREDFAKVIDYSKSPADYIVVEDVDQF